ncbi:MAG: hypothetical protein WBD22_10515 [Pyrinomonadaceae bacterium]
MINLLIAAIMRITFKFKPLFVVLVIFAAASDIAAQSTTSDNRQRVRTVTIPISIFTKKEIKEGQAQEFIQAERLVVKEDREEQTILSIRSVASTPLALGIVIQDDLTANINLQLREVSRFIRTLPRGSRVMVAYISGGSLQIRQKFTEDLEKASNSIRIVSGSAAAAPRNPYDGVIEALDRFDALPTGRRALLVVSDGLDSGQLPGGFSVTQSPDLDRAILRAQRRGVAIYSIYSPATFTARIGSPLILGAQGALQRLSDETGGRAFFQGSVAPISFVPFFRELTVLLSRQFSLTYLSTHMKKGYHRVDVLSTNPEVKIEHPKGYYYR